MPQNNLVNDKVAAQLSFPNVKEVFGRDDYNLRVAIAQTLLRKGENIFGSTKMNDHKTGLPFKEWSHYHGTPDQNEKLAKISTAKLRNIKDDVLKCARLFTQCTLDFATAKLPDRPKATPK